jgi:Type III secretion protein (HpaP)
MSDKRTTAYKALKVHSAAARTTARDTAPQPDSLRPRFSDLMKRRPAVPPAPTPTSTHPDRDDADGIDEAFDALGDGQTDPTERDGRHDAGASAEALLALLPGEPDAVGIEPPTPDRVGAAAAVEAARPAPLGDPLDLRMVEYIATTVTRFCNDSAVRDGDGWQIRIALRADVLPATTLHLSLSPHWLLLRFETADERSRHLLSSHRETLESSLDKALVPRRDVSITCD